MELRSLEIRNLFAKSLKGDYEGVLHKKSLPCLSVVQPLCGNYEVSLRDHDPILIEEGAAFVAPSGASQRILHRNGRDDVMEAHWVFMSVTVNELYSLEEVFELPVKIPVFHAARLKEILEGVRSAPTVCSRYEAAYRLVDFLISLSVPLPVPGDPVILRLRRYVEEHYRTSVTQEELAKVAACSVPNIYRIFSKNFGLSPRNYVNKVRLEKAAILLETSALSVTEVAQGVGFEDAVYFSRLFKEKYGISPKNYRAAK